MKCLFTKSGQKALSQQQNRFNEKNSNAERKKDSTKKRRMKQKKGTYFVAKKISLYLLVRSIEV